MVGFEHDLGIEIEIGIGIGKRCEMIEVGRTAGVEKVEVGEKVLAVVPRNLSYKLGRASLQARRVHSAHVTGFESKNGSEYDHGRSHLHH